MNNITNSENDNIISNNNTYNNIIDPNNTVKKVKL
jgi:hypothetical protein